eukprot:CAMPEP_0194317234 /NCGR_PEP_ID=MMETSP0171-20130528/13972_1 /TAXON_ID=218684 /ORGANISM="Corethron pennatum, Strain L29A3" /LENGTH=401 /DNA_ID=CAMNT_0039073745 /DNA_START=269 /DNA_END=1475 /DNA_ORIENTATION=+
MFQPSKWLINDFVEEAKLGQATSIGESPVMFAGEEEEYGAGTSFDFKRWEMHRSSKRYSRLLVGVLFGSTTRRVFPTVVFLVAFSTLVDLYNYAATPLSTFPPSLDMADAGFVLPQLQLPIIPFELTAPILGLLLVFRTDAAYERFNSGSELSWEITASLRNVMRRLVSWTGRDTVSDTEREAGHDLIDACCILHGWIMSEYLRGGASEKNSFSLPQKNTQSSLVALLHAALDANAGDAAEIDLMSAQMQMTPSLAMTAITLGAARRLPSLTDQEHIAIDDGFSETTKALAKCEKLLRTPIPLGYTRYTVRLLFIWLVLLPFALVRPFYEFGDQPLLVLAMFFISSIFLSIEDIAVQIEEPFVTLPLEKHQKWLLWDAEQIQKLMRWSSTRGRGQGIHHIP